MTWRRIGLYYALCVVLGGYFLLFEWRDEKPVLERQKVEIEQRFLPLSRGEIHELVLRRDKISVTCRRDGQIWKVIEPVNAQVTSALITSFVENLTPEKEVRIIDEAPGDLSPYGLVSPYSSIAIKGAGGKPLATVLIGGYNPTTSAVYARKEHSSQVVLLGYSVRYYEDLIFEGTGLDHQ